MIKINLEIQTDEERKTQVVFHGEQVIGEETVILSKEEAVAYLADFLKSLSIYGAKAVM